MLTIIPDVVRDQALRALGPADTARAAAALMAEHDVSAVPVLDANGRLLGLVTEQDIVRRVVAAGLDPGATPLTAIMTAAPETVPPDETPLAALERMRLGRFRHLPVVDGDRVVAIVSMRDLRHTVARSLKAAPPPAGLARLWRGLTGRA